MLEYQSAAGWQGRRQDPQKSLAAMGNRLFKAPSGLPIFIWPKVYAVSEGTHRWIGYDHGHGDNGGGDSADRPRG